MIVNGSLPCPKIDQDYGDECFHIVLLNVPMLKLPWLPNIQLVQEVPGK